jgi:hypothetical protein
MKFVDLTGELGIEFREIHKFHQEKKKQKKLYNFGKFEFFILESFTCCFKKKFEFKRRIVQKAIEITRSYMDIVFIIKEFMQLNCLKRSVMSVPQLNLLKYQNKYLNLGDPEETEKYLDSLKNTRKIDEDMFDKEQEKKDVDLKMCEGLINYYNY